MHDEHTLQTAVHVCTDQLTDGPKLSDYGKLGGGALTDIEHCCTLLEFYHTMGTVTCCYGDGCHGVGIAKQCMSSR